jgi:hypothetical protein
MENRGRQTTTLPCVSSGNGIQWVMIRIGMAPKDRYNFLFVGEKKATK